MGYRYNDNGLLAQLSQDRTTHTHLSFEKLDNQVTDYNRFLKSYINSNLLNHS